MTMLKVRLTIFKALLWLAPLLTMMSCAAQPALAATIGVTPATFAATFATAAPGDTLTLEPGDYLYTSLRRGPASPPITIDARAARIVGLVFYGVDGVILKGGDVGPNPAKIAGVRISGSRNVTVDGVRFSGLYVGLSVDRSTDLALTANTFTAMRADGINLGGAQRVRIAWNRFAATLVPAENHPDATQMWSLANFPTTDVLVEYNYIDGDTQGITGFGLSVDYRLARITYRRNRVAITYPQASALGYCDGCAILDNELVSLPGGRYRVMIDTRGSTDIVRLGNTIDAKPAL